MKTLMYIMSNDVKWMEYEVDLPFAPYPGHDFTGISGEQPLRITGMSYDIPGQFYKLRLGWLSPDPMMSQDMLALNVGWKIKTA